MLEDKVRILERDSVGAEKQKALLSAELERKNVNESEFKIKIGELESSKEDLVVRLSQAQAGGEAAQVSERV